MSPYEIFIERYFGFFFKSRKVRKNLYKSSKSLARPGDSNLNGIFVSRIDEYEEQI